MYREEQLLVEQIEQKQQDEEIENLLKRKMKPNPRYIKDPVHHQLYVDWESGLPSKKRTKTEINLSSHLSRPNLRSKIEQQVFDDNKKKHFSQSVQLPKISKRIDAKNIAVAEQRNSDFALYKSTKPKIPQPRSLRRNAIGLNANSSVNPTPHRTINEEEEDEKRNRKSQKLQKIKPYQQSLFKKINANKNNLTFKKNQKNGSLFYKEWMLIDILKLETYFIKLKKNKRQQAIEKAEIKQEGFISDKKMTLPSKQKIPDFIKSYKCTNPQIQVNELVKKQDFKVIYDEGQSLYFGETGQGKKTKVGVLIKKENRFEGIWRNGQRSEGYEITPQGYYKGSFKQEKRHGQGQFHWKSGEFYTGEWRKGVKHGSGMWKSGKGDTYIGEWKNGNVQGLGVHNSVNGQRYEGQFVSFLKQGKGKQVFPNGDIYEGQYRKGKPHGIGKYTWKNQIVFEGTFVDGYRHGNGTISAKNYLDFMGNFQREKINGFGKLKYHNGDEYEGEFMNGQKHGNGIMKLKNQQKILTGLWKNNKFNFQSEYGI